MKNSSKSSEVVYEAIETRRSVQSHSADSACLLVYKRSGKIGAWDTLLDSRITLRFMCSSREQPCPQMREERVETATARPKHVYKDSFRQTLPDLSGDT